MIPKVWDATMLAALMRNPVEFKWRYIDGWRDPHRSADVLWGSAWDECAGIYLDEGLEAAIRKAVTYGDLAMAGTSNKNIKTLVRALIWYDEEERPFKPIRAAERLETSVDKFTIVANIDHLIEYDGKTSALERKTTKNDLTEYFYQSYDPSVQINVYDYVMHNVTGGSVLLEGCQCGVSFNRFTWYEIHRTELQRAHWEKVMKFWLKFALYLDEFGLWDEALNLATSNWSSKEREIQKHHPLFWNGMLEAEFENKHWDPMNIG